MKASTLTTLSWPQPRARPQCRQRGTVSDHTVSTKADNKAGNDDENGSIIVGEGKMRGPTLYHYTTIRRINQPYERIKTYFRTHYK